MVCADVSAETSAEPITPATSVAGHVSCISGAVANGSVLIELSPVQVATRAMLTLTATHSVPLHNSVAS